MGREYGTINPQDTHHSRQMPRAQCHHLQKEAGDGKKKKFCRTHYISDEGIQPDEEKYAAISRFPRPKSVKDLRSFLGLAQQVAAFVPDLAHMTSTLHPLLKKDIAWTWTDDHEKSFIEGPSSSGRAC